MNDIFKRLGLSEEATVEEIAYYLCAFIEDASEEGPCLGCGVKGGDICSVDKCGTSALLAAYAAREVAKAERALWERMRNHCQSYSKHNGPLGGHFCRVPFDGVSTYCRFESCPLKGEKHV